MGVVVATRYALGRLCWALLWQGKEGVQKDLVLWCRSAR
jgi:hypothetical protein